MKYSKQRHMILECVKNSLEHPTAETIYKSVKQQIPNISLGTVYRNLNLLSELGQIKKVVISSDSDRFDQTIKNHSHIHCIKCNKVEDIGIEEEIICKNIETTTAYQLLSYDMVFEGICQNCQQKEGKK